MPARPVRGPAASPTSSWHYDLPPDLVAQEPPARREDARLLVLDRGPGALRHRHIVDLPSLLVPGDLLVCNDTKVLPARLLARRRTGGRVEVLLLEPHADEATWDALVRAGGRLAAGEVLALGGGDALRLIEPLEEGRWRVAAAGTADVRALMARHGRMPLPPYVRRRDEDPRDALDRERYQTVFARAEGAVAAPTAALHLTPGLLAALGERGVHVAFLTLHVGLGTFAPIRAEHLEEHPVHEEAFEVPAATAAAVRRARAEGRRVVAVGTTSVRALEAAAASSLDRLPGACAGRTGLFILPGHRFLAVDALLTNFHLPRTTLLALVAAFAGRDRILDAYREAVARRYRFFSYGDAMLIT